MTLLQVYKDLPPEQVKMGPLEDLDPLQRVLIIQVQYLVIQESWMELVLIKVVSFLRLDTFQDRQLEVPHFLLLVSLQQVGPPQVPLLHLLFPVNQALQAAGQLDLKSPEDHPLAPLKVSLQHHVHPVPLGAEMWCMYM